jgi:4a-hydroxytetrahydrobiopterin dehydratase
VLLIPEAEQLLHLDGARRGAQAPPLRVSQAGFIAASAMAAISLTDDQITQLPQLLPQWQLANGKLRRELRFADFVEAFGFMAKVALVAEAMGHHPEWSNVWNRVVIELTTHVTGGLSSFDLELAQRIDALLA